MVQGSPEAASGQGSGAPPTWLACHRGLQFPGCGTPPCGACRREAARDAASEPILSSMLHACILSHDSFEQALAFVLAKRLASSTLLAMELGEGPGAVRGRQPRWRMSVLGGRTLKEVEQARTQPGVEAA